MTRTAELVRRIPATILAVDASTRGTRPTGRQTAVTLLWLLAMIQVATVRTGRTELPDLALWIGIVGAWAPLLLRTYRPLVALTGTVVAESAILVFLSLPADVARAASGMGAYQPAPLATMLAVATFASRAPRVAGWVSGLVAGGVLAVVGLTTQSSETVLTDLVVFYVVVTAAALGVWRAGRRERAQRLAEEREAHTQQAVLDERLRIARELHDVLAHNLTLVNAQAGVARYLLRAQPDAAEQALRDITQHTGRAIDELRATIGLLRGPDAADAGHATEAAGHLGPVPGLAALDELVASFGTAGTEVRPTVTGIPRPLTQQVDLAAYRIVQEALTNAAKHAPGTVVDVQLAWTTTGVRLRVVNPADRRPDHPPAPGTGNGLIGMRERAASAGGVLRAGRTSDGGFEVVATLPADPRADHAPAEGASP
ncbi:sensor histidine kinase [Cellulomonas sp. Marseille-Q8402]